MMNQKKLFHQKNFFNGQKNPFLNFKKSTQKKLKENINVLIFKKCLIYLDNIMVNYTKEFIFRNVNLICNKKEE